MDPITDIFKTMHVAAVVHSRLEATAPWGLMRSAETEEKVTPSGKKISPSDLAHFGMVSRGNCWLSVDGIPDPIPLTGGDCFLLAPRRCIRFAGQPAHSSEEFLRGRAKSTERCHSLRWRGCANHHYLGTPQLRCRESETRHPALT